MDKQNMDEFIKALDDIRLSLESLNRVYSKFSMSIAMKETEQEIRILTLERDRQKERNSQKCVYRIYHQVLKYLPSIIALVFGLLIYHKINSI